MPSIEPSPHVLAQFDVSAREFRATSLRAIQVRDFFVNNDAKAVANFLGQARFGPIRSLHGASGQVDEAGWNASDDSERFFHYEMIDGRPDAAISRPELTYLAVRQYLASPSFRLLVSSITGVELTESTRPRTHRFRTGHRLERHNDRIGNRRIAYILYLSPDWHGDYDGRLVIVTNGAETSFAPLFNSLVLFDVACHDEHYVQPLNAAAADWTRDSVSGWLCDAPG